MVTKREMQHLKAFSCRHNGGNLCLKNLRMPIRAIFLSLF